MEGGGGNKKSEKQLREPRSEKEEQKEMIQALEHVSCKPLEDLHQR